MTIFDFLTSCLRRESIKEFFWTGHNIFQVVATNSFDKSPPINYWPHPRFSPVLFCLTMCKIDDACKIGLVIDYVIRGVVLVIDPFSPHQRRGKINPPERTCLHYGKSTLLVNIFFFARSIFSVDSFTTNQFVFWQPWANILTFIFCKMCPFTLRFRLFYF